MSSAVSPVVGGSTSEERISIQADPGRLGLEHRRHVCMDVIDRICALLCCYLESTGNGHWALFCCYVHTALQVESCGQHELR